MWSLVSGQSKARVRIASNRPTVSLTGSDVGPDKGRNLASGYRTRFSSCEAFSSIVGNRAINNGATINAFPCVEDEKKI